MSCKSVDYCSIKCLRVNLAVGPDLSTKRDLKQIIATECTKTAICQLLWPLDISELVA